MTAVRSHAFGADAMKIEEVEDPSPGQPILDLYEKERLPLTRYCVWIGLDRASAEEVVQDSFLKLHQHLASGASVDSHKAWIYRVAHNLARNTQGSARTSRSVQLSDALPVAMAGPSVEESFLGQEQRGRLLRALARLTEPQRNCLLLRSQGLKYREIASVLQLSTSAVAENVTRGLNNLKKVL